MRAAEAGSARDRIARLRDELRGRKTIDLLVPGYQGELGVRYRAIEDEEFDKLVAKIQGAGGANASNMDAACDFLIKACEAILVRVGDELETLDNEAGIPLKFTRELAVFLGIAAEEDEESMTARQVVRALFSPEGSNPLAPAVHSNALVDWLQGNESAIDRALRGES